MKQGMLIILAVCAFADAMVPMDRSSSTAPAPARAPADTTAQICAPTTPCGWRVYDNKSGEATFIENKYCICGAGTECEEFEANNESSTLYRCKAIPHK